jgi:inosine-uridine nucleoside N-ribohydrolase
MKLIIDTDPGVDDAMTYFYAHAAPEIDLLALTTIFGNVTIDDAVRNALWLTEFSGSSATVHRGETAPLAIVPNHHSDFVHGKRGFGDFEIADPARVENDEDAVSYLIRMASENPQELTLCAIGPLTNVAKAVQRDPDFVGNLKQLVIMGGSLDAGGNITPHAEANFWNDPHAADIVLNAPGGGRVVIVGLDVTMKIIFDATKFDDLAAVSPKTGDFLRQIGQFYMRFYESVTGTYQCFLHDPAALIACEDGAPFGMEQHRLSVVIEGEEIGKMVRREGDDGRECHVCTTVDAAAVIARYTDIVSRNP